MGGKAGKYRHLDPKVVAKELPKYWRDVLTEEQREEWVCRWAELRKAVCSKCERLLASDNTCQCAYPERAHTCLLVSFKDGVRKESQVPCECDAAHAGVCCDCYERAMGWPR